MGLGTHLSEFSVLAMTNLSAFLVDISVESSDLLGSYLHPARIRTYTASAPTKNMSSSPETSGCHSRAAGTIPGLTIVPSGVTLGRSLSVSEPQVISYLHNGINIAKIKRLFRGLNEPVFAKGLAACDT